MNENEIPIDIQISKLLDWLISRRHVSKEWQKSVLPIREKINTAIQDMPAHDGIVKLLSGTHINYFHCLKIIEILKETESDTKNIFGRYGSQRMKDWQEVIRLYEKDNVYLAEAAQILSRNINYEIPSLKKQLAKLDQTQSECEKKQEDYIKNQAAARSEYAAICREIGIKGEKIKTELCERLKELPDIYNAIAKKVPSLSAAVEHYKWFSQGVHLEEDQEILPMLSYLMEKGNTTTYEWVHGEPPLTIQPDELDINLDDEIAVTDTQVGVDYGDNTIDLNIEETIDFGDIPGENSEIEIDWGDVGSMDVANQDPISVEAVDFSAVDITIEGTGLSGGVASGSDALTIMDSPKTREGFITDLLELEAFLKMRVYVEGVGSKGGEEVLLTLEGAVESKLSLEVLLSLLESVRTVISAMMSPAITHLHNVKHSPRYVDSLSAQLRQKLSLCEKMDRLIAAAKQKREDMRQQSVALAPLSPLITQQTGLLQNQMEQDISKKYKGRPVNLIGGVRG